VTGRLGLRTFATILLLAAFVILTDSEATVLI